MVNCDNCSRFWKDHMRNPRITYYCTTCHEITEETHDDRPNAQNDNRQILPPNEACAKLTAEKQSDKDSSKDNL